MLIWAYYARNDYRSVDVIHPDVIREPIQTKTENQNIIQFSKNDYRYDLTPLYEYELNGLIVHKMDYRLFSIYKIDSVFPMDLCIMWGNNVKNKVYKSKSLKFSQDQRFAFWRWSGDINFNNHEVANVHLIIKDQDLESKIKNLNVGDQVKIKGQLVEVNAENIGKPGKYDPPKYKMKSSTVRTDSGAGACEILNVENLDILEKANVLPVTIFKMSYIFLLLLVLGNVIWFIFSLMTSSNTKILKKAHSY